MTTALLLAGGGARGIIQAGQLKGFADSGLQYDAIYGASVGSINGALFHADQLDDLLKMWLEIQTKDVYKFNPLTLPLRVLDKEASIFDNSPLKKKLKDLVNVEKLAANPKPFYIRATDVSHNKGQIRTAKDPKFLDYLVASASPPLAFPPVRIGTQVLIDGGIYNNFGIDEAIADGHDRLIVMSPTCPSPNNVSNILEAFDALASAPEYALNIQLKMVEINNGRPGKRYIEVVLIRPPVSSGIGLLDFNLGTVEKRKKLIDFGYRMAAQALKSVY